MTKKKLDDSENEDQKSASQAPQAPGDDKKPQGASAELPEPDDGKSPPTLGTDPGAKQNAEAHALATGEVTEEAKTIMNVDPAITQEAPGQETVVNLGDGGEEIQARNQKVGVSADSPDAQPGNGQKRYKVWEHGTLTHEGVVYQPGQKIVMSEEAAKAIPALVVDED